jgi:primosomal protein N' (replication factor Y) (superfamily II helicase)
MTRYVRVLPDEAAIGKAFDYEVPANLAGADLVRVGSEVRVELHGRRIGGWILSTDVQPPAGVTIRPISKVRGLGAPQQVIDLAMWAAWRWGGRPANVLRFTSPPTAVRHLPPRHRTTHIPTSENDPLAQLATAALHQGGTQLVRTPPTVDRFGLILEVVRTGGSNGALIVAPSRATAEVLTRRLRRIGIPTALLPHDWAMAASGGCVVVGARAAAFAPIADPGAVLVIDEHDESHQDERTPTWHARDVCIERARRLEIPCLLTSPVPTLEALRCAAHDVWTLDRREERAGWSSISIIDRSSDEPGRQGLVASGAHAAKMITALRTDERVLCILNRTGRARMLACTQCTTIAACETCGAAIQQLTEAPELSCPRCSTSRPVICAHCGGGRMKNLRMGTSRAREELEALADRPVGEVTAATDTLPDTPVIVGTEALLHRVDRATTIIFLDIDSELLAPRHRAQEHALALLARAARLVTTRKVSAQIKSMSSSVFIQTRQPEHLVIQAALQGDPDRWTDEQRAVRNALRLPPFWSLAVLSGASAPAWADLLRPIGGLEVSGPADGRYLLRTQTIDTLAEAIATIQTTRPSGRVRIEVDPLRM